MIAAKGNEWWHQQDVTTLGERAECQHPHLVWSYITNLERLGVVRSDDTFFTADATYAQLEDSREVEAFRALVEGMNSAIDRQTDESGAPPPGMSKTTVKFERRRLLVTPFGELFLKAWVNRDTPPSVAAA